MPQQGWQQLLNWGAPWQAGPGTALTTGVTATISPQAAGPKDFAVGTQYLYVSAVLRCTAQGFITYDATGVTSTVFLAAGATPTTLVTPNGVIVGAGNAVTGMQFEWVSYSRITAIGATGNTISTQGKFTMFNAGGGTIALPANPASLSGNAGLVLPAPNASGETAAAVDTTIAMPIMLRGTLSTAHATVQCTQFLVEHLG